MDDSEFIFCYELERKFEIDITLIFEAIRRDLLQPYDADRNPIRAPCIAKKSTCASEGEILRAALDELRIRRELRKPPLVPLTQDYDKWFEDHCREQDYSWAGLEDSVENRSRVRGWLFRRGDAIKALRLKKNRTPDSKKAVVYAGRRWEEANDITTDEMIFEIIEKANLSREYAHDTIRKWIQKCSPHYESGKRGRKGATKPS